MSALRRAVLVDVDAQEDASILVTAEPGGIRYCISAEETAQRDELVARATDARHSTPGTSFVTGDRDRDRAALRAELLWSALRSWDLEHVLRPLLARLEPWSLVLHPGRCRLEHLSFRGALHEGLLTGAIDERTLQSTCGLPYWSAPGLEHLLDRAIAGALPVVDPKRMALLVAPPPDRIATNLLRIPRSQWESTLHAALPDLRAAKKLATFESELFGAATEIGIDVVYPATRRALMDRLGARVEGSALFLIAHQDAEGLHFADGALPIGAIRAAFVEHARSGAIPHDTVDLGVCGAEGEGNLAEWFQARGSPIVMTRGMTSFYGRDIVAALTVVRRLAQHGPAVLPMLVDEIWVGLHLKTVAARRGSHDR